MTTIPSSPELKRRTRRYWTRLLVITILAIAIPALVLPFAAGAWEMWTVIHPTCGTSGTPADYGLPYREVNIPTTSGGVWRGFFMAGTKDATIIAPAAYTGDRGGILYEAALLAQDGYNVLTIESVICAGHTVHSLGYLEVGQIADALAYLKKNSDGIQVNLTKIALHGFSSAGASSIMAAARYPEIAAVLAEGNYSDIGGYLRIGNTGNPLTNLLYAPIILGATTAYHLGTGINPSVLSPIQVIGSIPPRPVYLIYGSLELNRTGAQAEFNAARAAKGDAFAHLWIVPGADHGGYIYAVGNDEYRKHVLPFYDCALLNDCVAWNALIAQQAIS